MSVAKLTIFFLLSTPAHAVDAIVFSQDYSKEKPRKLHEYIEILKDKKTASGLAIKASHIRGQWLPPLVHTRNLIRLAGRARITARVRGKGFIGIASQLRLVAVFRNEKTQRSRSFRTSVHGVRVSEAEYTTLHWEARLPAMPADYHFYVRTSWLRDESEPPAVWVEKIEVMAPHGSVPFISEVEPDRTTYRPGRRINLTVTVSNPSAAALKGSILIKEFHGLTGVLEIRPKRIRVSPGSTQPFTITWKAKPPDAGREIQVILADANGKTLDTEVDYFGIARDPSFLATLPLYDDENGLSYTLGYLYVGPASLSQTRRAIEVVKARRLQRSEFFSWSYNELGAFIPPKKEEPFLGNEGIWWQSMKKLKRQFWMMKEIGPTTITYINGHLWGPAAYELFKQHPEWFLYTRDGELKSHSYDMRKRAKYQHRHDFDFTREKPPFFFGVLNPLLPESRRHISDQIIRVARELGFEGARWDVWSMDVHPGDCDIYGRSLVSSQEEADRLWAESLAAVKSLVAMEFPNFTWGYNYASLEENEHTPLVLAEKCRNGGWMLDERAYMYGGKNSPYHYWDTYRDQMASWGDRIRQLGGTYNPFALNRSGGRYAADRLYEGIFRLLGSGRASNIYENNASLAGRLGLLAFRHSNLILGRELRLQPGIQGLVTVEAPETIWWKTLVFSNRSYEGRPQTIVHLVNSPLSREIEEDPNSKVRPPVKNIKVTCGRRNGRTPARAWLVMAEPLEQEDAPKVQAVPWSLENGTESAHLVVPNVFYWKIVVFEF